MRKYLYLTMAALSLVILPVAGVYAQNFGGDNDFDIRPYAGVGIGAFGLEFKDDTGSVKKTVFGGYGKVGVDIGDYLGAELRFGSTASGSKLSPLDPTITVTMSDDYFLTYLGKLQYPVTPDLHLYTMLGATTAKIKLTNSIGFNQSQTKTGFSYGFGTNYYVQNTLSVGAEWMQYWSNVKLSNAFGPNAKEKIWGAVVTVAYHF